MAGASHATAGVHGPVDLREIRPDEIGEARQRLGALLRDVKAADGHRAAAVTALAAILAAMDGAMELGLDSAALGVLRMCAATLEQRETSRSAGEHGETRH